MRYKIIVFLYLSIAIIPYFGAADKVDTQVLYLNILNIFNIIYLLKIHKNKFVSEIKSSLTNIPVILMGIFFVWSFITIIVAANKVESLISLSELFTIWVALVFLVYHFSKIDIQNRSKFILTVIISLSTIELISVYIPYLYDIIEYGRPRSRSLAYRGISGNLNIMAYSMLLKLPFLLYYSFINKFNKIYLFTLITLITYAIISIFQTRSAILTLILLALIVFTLFVKFNDSRIFESLKKGFLKILFPLILGLGLSYAQSNLYLSQNVQERLETLSNIEEDGSLQQRLRYYKAAYQSFLENPIFGIGVGNWEIESVKYDRSNMNDYTVPYHAHNDYLEILAESGIPALIFFFGPLFLIFFFLFKLIFFEKVDSSKKLLYVTLLCALTSYLIDSLFNFPQARMMQQMNLLFILTLSISYLNLKTSFISLKNIKRISYLIFILALLSLYSSIRVYESSRDQFVLLRQFNLSDFSYPPIEEIEKMQSTYPNLSPTAMPLASMKALHYMTADNNEKAIKLFKEGTVHNPYLYLSETFLGYTYDKIGKIDSALYYTKYAFDNAPNDPIHFGNYLNSLVEVNDTLMVKDAYLKVPEKYRLSIHDEIYLNVISSLANPSSPEFTLDGLDINYQAGNDGIKKGYYMSKIGSEKMYNADYYYQLGMIFFEQENYSQAADYFKSAGELNPYEFIYLENAANSLMKIDKDKEALEILNKLIDELEAQNPKIFYLRGLILYDLKQNQKACKDLKVANDAGLFGNTNLFWTLCK
jgi:O-antigen ligase/Tfp pilus assembly protein PilF